MGVERQGTISLRGLRARGYHGVFAHERTEGQEFVVDLEIDATMPEQDSIDDTVDYGVLAGKVVAIITGEPVDLIETLSERIASEILADERIGTVRVTVHKPSAPIAEQFDDVAVTISRSNHV